MLRINAIHNVSSLPSSAITEDNDIVFILEVAFLKMLFVYHGKRNTQVIKSKPNPAVGLGRKPGMVYGYTGNIQIMDFNIGHFFRADNLKSELTDNRSDGLMNSCCGSGDRYYHGASIETFLFNLKGNLCSQNFKIL